MVMDAMIMNQCYAGECLIKDKKSNADATEFFELKDFY